MKKIICSILLFITLITTPNLITGKEGAKAFVNDFRYKTKVTKTYYKWNSKKCAGPHIVTEKLSKDVTITGGIYI